jgi:hypothetical protein
MAGPIVPNRVAARPTEWAPSGSRWASGQIDPEWRPLTLLALTFLLDIVITRHVLRTKGPG